MVISDIVEISASKKKIFIDQEFAFVLYKGELRKYGLKSGENIRPEIYREITEELLPKRAKLRCMNLLQTKDYTKEQLRQKLRQGFYPETVIEEALGYVASYGYVDDLRYASDFIYYNQEHKSRKRIEIDLLKKGIAKETVLSAWVNWEEQGNVQDEECQIMHLLEKKRFDGNAADAKEMQKIYRFLLRKGFKPEKVRKVLGKYGDEMDNLYD